MLELTSYGITGLVEILLVAFCLACRDEPHLSVTSLRPVQFTTQSCAIRTLLSDAPALRTVIHGHRLRNTSEFCMANVVASVGPCMSAPCHSWPTWKN
jgi:hypothetical protein